MATVDSLDIKISAQANSASASLDKLVGKLNTLSSSLNKINGSGLTGLANGVNRLATSMQAMKSVGTADFTRLAKNIEKLGNLNVANLNSAASSMSNLTRAFNQLGGVSASAQQVGVLASNLSKLGYKSISNAVTNLPALTRELNNLMTTLSRAPRVSGNVIQMTNALANLASQGGRVGTASRTLVNGLNNSTNAMNRASKSSMSLAAAFGKFYASWFLVIRGIKKLWKSVESSMDYVEVLNYFDAAFTQVAEKADLRSFKELGYDSADEYAKSFSERAKQLTAQMTGFAVTERGTLEATGMPSLGLDPSQLMQYQAMFGQMASSMGVASETSLKLSRALTEIGADLASVKNMDFNKVWNDMASGLAGMSRTLDKYGVNIRNVNLQQKLTELGINASITALNQNDKALLRTIILLDSTRYAWGDMADTINQPANQLRLIKANFQNLGRTIGNLFLPLVQKVLPYINALTIALQRLFTWLGNLLGVDLSKISNAQKNNENLQDIYDSIEDVSDGYDDATKAAKAYENQILDFDEITKLQEPKDTDTSTSTGGGVPSGLLDAAFEKSLSEYQKVWDTAFENMENRSQKMADRIEKSFESIKNALYSISLGNYKKAGYTIGNAISNSLESIKWESVYKKTRNFGKGLADFLNGLISPKLFGNVGKTIASSLNTALYPLNSFGKTFDWKNFGNSIAEGINNFFSTFDFKNAAKTINVWIKGALNTVSTLLKKTDFEKIGKKIGEFLSELDLLEIAGNLAKSLLEAINSAFDLLEGMIKEAPIETSLIVAFGALKFTGLTKKLSSLLAPVPVRLSLGASTLGAGVIQKTIIEPIISKLPKNIIIPVELNMGESFEKAKKEIETLQREYEENAKERKKSLEGSEEEIYYIDALWKKYEELADKAKKTNEEKRMQKYYADELIKQAPELEGMIDEETGGYKSQKEEIKKVIDNLKKKIKIEALQSVYTEALKEQYKQEKALNDLRKNEDYVKAVENHKKAIEEESKAREEYWKAFDENGNLIPEYADKVEELNEKWSDAKGKLDVARVATENWKEQERELNRTLKQAREEAGYYETSIENIMSGTDEVAKSTENATKKSQTYSEESKKTYSEVSTEAEKSTEKINNATEQIKIGKIKINTDSVKNAISNIKEKIPVINKIVSGIKDKALKISINSKEAEKGFLGTVSNFQKMLNELNLPSFNIGLELNQTKTGEWSLKEKTRKKLLPKSYSVGGFPEDGLFFANHSELVGQFSNGKTAVANNAQITAGIEEAAYRGMIRALSESEGNEKNVTFEVQSDPNKIFKVVQKEAKEYTMKTGKSAFLY